MNLILDEQQESLWPSDRLYWENDPQYREYEKVLFETKATFEETLKFSTFDTLPLSIVDEAERELFWQKVKETWKSHIGKWNACHDEYREEGNERTVLFAALTMLVVSFPFEKIRDPHLHFKQSEIEMFNRAYWYNTNNNLPFLHLVDLQAKGPKFPPAYSDWADRLYNNAAWWIGYIIYERRNKLSHIQLTNMQEDLPCQLSQVDRESKSN